MTKKNEKLTRLSEFVLFVTSYLPLFILIIIRQVSENWNYLNWYGIHWDPFLVFIKRFGLSTILIFISLVGGLSYHRMMINLERNADNGYPVKILSIKNKNGEVIGYIATYIIPFLFRDFDQLSDLLSLVFLLIVIYKIYVNSSLLLINPVLSLKYTLYEIQYEDDDKKKEGMCISIDKELMEDDVIQINELGTKLFFAKPTKK